MKIKLILIYLLNLFDYIMTVRQINKYGIDIEANPIMRACAINGGFFFVIKVLFVGLMVLLMWYYRNLKISKYGSWLLLVVYGALAIYHIYLNFI